eukprot:2891855-Lingulodinium_polyedra.AAC.1
MPRQVDSSSCPTMKAKKHTHLSTVEVVLLKLLLGDVLRSFHVALPQLERPPLGVQHRAEMPAFPSTKPAKDTTVDVEGLDTVQSCRARGRGEALGPYSERERA